MKTNALQDFLLTNCKDMTNEEIVELFAEKKVFVKFTDDLMIFNYMIAANFADPVVKNCRGIILYRDDFSIACYPFDKFNEWDNINADNIDWESSQIQMKYDGSLIKLWFNKRTNKWIISTMSVIYAEDAYTYDMKTNYRDLFIELASKQGMIFNHDYSQCNIKNNKVLDTDMTYIFELVSVHNKLIVLYNEDNIYHIGTRNNITLEECQIDIGIYKPVIIPVSNKNIEETLKIAEKLAIDYQNKTVTEGFVVVDKYYNRIKVKNSKYITFHYIISNLYNDHNIKVKNIIKFIREENLNEWSNRYPDFAHILRYYQWQIEEFNFQVKKIKDFIDRTKDTLTRKQIAYILSDNPYMSIAMKYLDNPYFEITDKIVMRYIKLYKCECKFKSLKKMEKE